MVETLESADYVTISVYFGLVLCVGIWASFRRDKGNAAGYFLAGKTMTWIPIGASLYASNVGAPMFIGLAGTAAASGFACSIYEWHALFLLIALGWFFVPVYVASGSFTMPEYLKKRFGGVRLRISLSILALAMYVLIKISSELFSGGLFLQQMLGWNLYACVGIIMVVTAIYTTAGGLAAVIYTDTLQTVILIIGACILFFLNITELGGWFSFLTRYSHAASELTLSQPENHSCGLPREDFMNLWRDPATADLPWTGSAIGLTTLGIVVWCTDQITVQRCLSAKNMSHSKGGAVLGGILKLSSSFLFIVPGMISRILYPDEIACSDPDICEEVCSNRAGCTNIAYPMLVLRKMPTGLRGVMLAALLAAIMSSLTSIFNSASTMFTLDVWRRFRKGAEQRELMIVGRLTVVVLTITSIVWIPVIQKSQGGQLWNYFQNVSACLAPPWCWIFILGLLWKGTTEAGAFWGLVISSGVGIIRMILDFIYTAPDCGSFEPDLRPAVLAKVHFLHFAIIISFVSIISTVVISLFTTPRRPEKLRRVTWWTRNDPLEPEESDSDGEDHKFDQGQEEEDPCSLRLHNRPWMRIVYSWWCGATEIREKMTPEEKRAIRERMTNIKETPKAKLITNVAAIVASAITVFFLGFFR